MKTVLLFVMTFSLSLAQNPTAELFVYYDNGPSNEHIVIVQDINYAVFDKYLKPLPANINTSFGGPQLYLDACYQGEGQYGEVNDPQTTGTVFYGKYQIDYGKLVNGSFAPTQGLTRFIDFRDDEYGWNLQGTAINGGADGYINQDFFVVCQACSIT